MIPPSLQWVDDELSMWSRWGREHAGPGDLPEPAIWNAWLQWNGRVAGYGLTIAQKEAEARGEVVVIDEAPPAEPIDEAQAEHADKKMKRLSLTDARSFVALHKHYYRWHKVAELELHTAMRHYADLPDNA